MHAALLEAHDCFNRGRVDARRLRECAVNTDRALRASLRLGWLVTGGDALFGFVAAPHRATGPSQTTRPWEQLREDCEVSKELMFIII